jgi:HlyD family secretion protein
MKLTRSRIVAVVVGLLILAALVWALIPKPVAADFAAVERAPLAVTVDEEGKTRVHDHYVVSAPVPGRVERIELEPGDPVKGGETVLARFLPSTAALLDARARAEAEARVRAAEASLGGARAQRRRAEAESDLAAKEVARTRSLAEQQIVSRQQLDSAVAAATAQEEAARAAGFAEATAAHELETARASLFGGSREGEKSGRAPAAVELRSPIDGVVLKRLRESESEVAAGEPLVEVGDPADLEIVSDLLSSDAVKVAAGDPVRIEQWGGGETLNGRVRRVEPAGFTKISALGVEEQRVNTLIAFEDPRQAWQALGDAYRVEVRIVIWQGDEVLQVPTSSLFRHGAATGAEAGGATGTQIGGGEPSPGGWAVYKVDGGRARLTPVEVGHRNGLRAEIVSGLAAGERVILHPSDAVADGVRVEERGG